MLTKPARPAMPHLSAPLALEVKVALAGLPVVDDAVVVFTAALVTGPVLGVAVPPMGAVYWPDMLVKLCVAGTFKVKSVEGVLEDEEKGGRT